MYAAIRPLLFALAPEAAHRLTIGALSLYGLCPGAIRPLPGTPRRVMGLDFENPVGLAAGLDKDARAVAGLARLGFGFIEVGTVTPRPQPGNERPRLFRLPAQQALINRMGFNNDGVAAMAARLARLRSQSRLPATRLGVNISQNKMTPAVNVLADFQHCFAAVAPYADYVTLNLSSPNTPGLRALQKAKALAELLEPLKVQQQALARAGGTYRPLALKVAPDLADDEVRAIARVLLDLEIDGLIATNTTIGRIGVAGPVAAQTGGLSGAPLTALARATVRSFATALGGRIPIIAVGGIVDAGTGQAMLDAGASLLQIYTGLIYRGPSLVRTLSAL